MNTLNFIYDKQNDVLYLTFGKPEPAVCKVFDIPNVLYRFNLKNEICGITVVGFSVHSEHGLGTLYDDIVKHTGIDVKLLEDKISTIGRA